MKFFHIRLEQCAQLRYLDKPPHAITVGYERVDREGRKLLVTFARCSERDVFSKAKARLICKGRMRKGVKIFEVSIPEGKDRYQILLDEALKHEKTFEQKRKEVGIKHQTIL